MSKNFNPSNFEYIEIDPRVMGASSDDYSDLNESFKLDMFGNALPMNENQLFPTQNSVDQEENTLKQILAELKEIKILLAGK